MLNLWNPLLKLLETFSFTTNPGVPIVALVVAIGLCVILHRQVKRRRRDALLRHKMLALPPVRPGLSRWGERVVTMDLPAHRPKTPPSVMGYPHVWGHSGLRAMERVIGSIPTLPRLSRTNPLASRSSRMRSVRAARARYESRRPQRRRMQDLLTRAGILPQRVRAGHITVAPNQRS